MNRNLYVLILMILCVVFGYYLGEYNIKVSIQKNSTVDRVILYNLSNLPNLTVQVKI